MRKNIEHFDPIGDLPPIEVLRDRLKDAKRLVEQLRALIAIVEKEKLKKKRLKGSRNADSTNP